MMTADDDTAHLYSMICTKEAGEGFVAWIRHDLATWLIEEARWHADERRLVIPIQPLQPLQEWEDEEDE